MIQSNSDNKLHVVPTEKKPVFYKLDNKEWLSVAKKLTHSELLVLYHLRTLEPFGERSTSSTTKAVAVAVGISQRSVQRALIKLAALKLIDLRFQKFDFSLRTQFTNDDEPEDEDSEEATALSPDNYSNTDATEPPLCDSAVANLTGLSSTRQGCHKPVNAVANSSGLSDSSSETYTARDFSPSKTNKTNQTNQTLSEATRERNLILWKKLDEETKNQVRYYAHQVALPKLPTKPTLPEAWINCHCEELFNQMMYDAQFQKQWGERSANSPTVENEQVVDW